MVTYIALLHRRFARLVRADLDAAAQEIRESLEKILARLNDPLRIRFAQRCAGMRVIEDLQDQLWPLTFPLRPVLVEGGKFTIGTDGFSTDEGPPHEVEIDSFLIDPCPVTNQQFQEFITDPDNRDWLPEAVYAKFGIPYFLCEFFEDISPPISGTTRSYGLIVT